MGKAVKKIKKRIEPSVQVPKTPMSKRLVQWLPRIFIYSLVLFLFVYAIDWSKEVSKFEYQYDGVIGKVDKEEITTEDLEDFHNIFANTCLDCAYNTKDGDLLDAYATHYRLYKYAKDNGIKADKSIVQENANIYLHLLKEQQQLRFSSVLLSKFSLKKADLRELAIKEAVISKAFEEKIYGEDFEKKMEELRVKYPLEIVKDGPWSHELPE